MYSSRSDMQRVADSLFWEHFILNQYFREKENLVDNF